MRHPIAAAVTAAVVVGAGAHGALGAGPGEPQSVRETVDVTLVEIPVRVIDRSGEPVRGLGAADFTLLDQGRPQLVTSVDAIELGERRDPAGSAAVPSAARRRYLLLFDFAFARPKAIVAARRAARDFVLSSMADTDLAAIATTQDHQSPRPSDTDQARPLRSARVCAADRVVAIAAGDVGGQARASQTSSPMRSAKPAR